MDDDRRSPIDDLAAMFPGLDTAAAARMVADVQRLGLDTAKVVIDRFSELAGRWPLAGRADGGGSPGAPAAGGAGPPSAQPSPPGAAGPSSAQPSASGGATTSSAPWPPFYGTMTAPSLAPGSQRQLQADAERAVDAYLNVVRRLYDVVAGLAGAPASTTDGPGPEPLRLPPASAGGTTSAYAWLHNTTPAAVTALTPRGAVLVDHQGRQLPGEALSFDPAAVDRLDPGASRQLLATLRVPLDAAPGTYHGLVLVEHLPGLALHVVAEVRPPAAPRDRG